MCGRAACSLNPDTLCRACEYKDAAGKRRTTAWTKSELQYKPSCNMGPRDVLPCVVAGSHFGNEDERVLCAMMWGMIPPWHEGDYRKHNMSTHNGRLENIQHSKLYSPSLRKGLRCIVVCEGFYEWKAGQTKKDKKQPYFIYSTQDKGVRIDDPATWEDEWSEETGWKGVKLLQMAGIFNTFKTAEGKIIHSCTIITTEAGNVLSWLHNRRPVFLNTEEDLQVWLDKDVTMTEAVDRLNQLKLLERTLSWYTVSTLVNSVTYKGDDCRKETKALEEKKSGPTGLMASWLKKGSAESAKRKSTNADDNVRKKSEGETTPKVSKKDKNYAI